MTRTADREQLAGRFELLQQTASKFGWRRAFRTSGPRRDGMPTGTSRSASIRSGDRFREWTHTLLTYRHLLRGLNDGERAVVNSVALAAAQDLTRHFQVLASLEHQRIAVDPSAQNRNTILPSAPVIPIVH